MKTVSKFTLGLLSVVGLVGCGAASETDVAQEGTVGKQTSALTYDQLAKGIKHDFNGDGIEDVVAVQSSGSTLLLGVWGGGFTPAWSRSDLSLGSVRYAVGDFNGDHRSDLIVITTYGSYEYLGATNGYFYQDIWIDPNLTYDSAEYVVGDFNDDGRSDLIVTTAGGSYEYLGKAEGGFDSYWNHPMVKGSVKYTTGDFNGDGTTDLIFTHVGGTTLYTGTAGPTGGFTPNVWISYDYLMNQCDLFAGDFNGDGNFDLIAQNFTDARELVGSSSAQLTSTSWVHPEYNKTGNINFIPGDYNNDGSWDLVVADGDGASLFPGLWYGGFDVRSWIRNKSLMDSYNTSFKSGDFSGDSKDDLLVLRDDGTTEYKGQTTGLGNSVWSGSMVRGDTVLY